MGYTRIFTEVFAMTDLILSSLSNVDATKLLYVLELQKCKAEVLAAQPERKKRC